MSSPTALRDVRRIARGPARRFFVSQLIMALGMGLTLALLVVYLVDVRGLTVATATLLLAWQSALTLVASPPWGTLVDRFGPRPVLLTAVLVEGLGVLAYGHVHTAGQAWVAMTVVAVGTAGIWGPAQVLTTRLVSVQDRSTAFGFSFMLLNLGLGLGGLVAATIIELDDPATFTLLYTLTAAAYLGQFLVLLTVGDVDMEPEHQVVLSGRDESGNQSAGAVPDDGSARSGWAQVLSDRTLVRFTVTALLMLTFGYGSMDAGVALFITSSAGLPAHFIGIAFAANTAVIVVAQLVVLTLIRGRARSRMLAGVAVAWMCAWLLFAGSLAMPGEAATVALLVSGMGVFALGETLWSPTAPALVNDLAPEHLRGRYNAIQSILWGVSSTLGPIITGQLLGRPHGGLLWALTLAVGCAVSALAMARLGRHLTPSQNGLADPS